MNHITLLTRAAALILTVAPAHADSSGFQGPYAPKSWSVTGAGIGSSHALFGNDGKMLTITGSDFGSASTIHVTHTVVADGDWSFHWSYIIQDANSPGFDVAYYTINDAAIFLSSSIFDPGGTVTVPVSAGQTIGWKVVTIDGIFGPGVLTISDFRITVPGPAALALLGFAAMPCAPRSRKVELS